MIAEPTQSPATPSDSDFPSGPQHELEQEHNCTCREPQGVILSRENKVTFIENLRTHGWSPIVVPEAPCPSPSQEELLAIFRRRRQREKTNHNNNNNNNNSDVTFIASESGSSEGTIEPKESLEVLLSKCETENGDMDRDEATVKAWCKTLSWIAHTICKVMLDLPENTFLPKDPKDSLDLLRVFHYYAAVEGSLGSSEHTDWGSLTVVWQDSVGGLQTYCRKRKLWSNVKPAAADNGKTKTHRWECIVHVGDMASLMLDQTSKIEIDNNSNDMILYPWPSPRHRVKSHPQKERVSLVYFGYPPRGLSLSEIQARLDDEGWPHSSTRGQRLPLREYFLLRNQSTTATGDINTEAGRLYKRMWNLPIQDIVRLKWEQVSRDG